MTIGSTGSVSFWQQDQNFWSNAKSQDAATTATDNLITSLGSAESTEAKGLASVATQTALDRTNAQLKAALESALQSVQGTSSSSADTNGAPATGTGTVPLTTNTSLLTLGIPANGTISVSDGTNTTTFKSTGTDTVGDLINTINDTTVAKNAQVTAFLNSSGKLVITGENDTDSISVGGLFASNVGFGSSNDSFQPTAPTSSSSSSSSTTASSTTSSSTSSSSTGSTSSTSTSTSTATFFNSSVALQTGSSAESLLSSAGLSGSLIDLLA
jgi:hypothetical protein